MSTVNCPYCHKPAEYKPAYNLVKCIYCGYDGDANGHPVKSFLLATPAPDPAPEPTLEDTPTEAKDPYFVQQEAAGCEQCGGGRSWCVMGPDGIAESMTWDDAEEAAEQAELLNVAYTKGQNSVRKNRYFRLEAMATRLLTAEQAVDILKEELAALRRAEKKS